VLLTAIEKLITTNYRDSSHEATLRKKVNEEATASKQHGMKSMKGPWKGVVNRTTSGIGGFARIFILA
jgi:hypothetical protein